MAREKKAQILPVASGKGGTGKSLLSVNLALAAARLGRKTLLADLDLGGSNVHTLLGQKNLLPGLGRMMVEKSLAFEALCHASPWPGLFYLPGDNQVPAAANIHAAQKRKVIRSLRAADFDLVVCDLAAGASLVVLDFFLISPRGLVVFTPEITSLLNAYAFLRQAFFRAASVIFSDNLYARRVLENFRASPPGSKGWTVARLAEELAKAAPGQEERLFRFLRWWRPGLVLNQIREASELKALGQLARLCQERLSVSILALGCLPFDQAALASVRARRPLVDFDPASPLARAVGELANRLESWTEILFDPRP